MDGKTVHTRRPARAAGRTTAEEARRRPVRVRSAAAASCAAEEARPHWASSVRSEALGDMRCAGAGDDASPGGAARPSGARTALQRRSAAAAVAAAGGPGSTRR